MVTIDPAAGIGWVSLTVSELRRAVNFYVGLMRLEKISETNSCVVLGVGKTSLVVLYEKKGAKPKPPNTRGLYHYAFLLPDRKRLAQLFTRLMHNWSFDGFADHLVSEAIYLSDPDGHGIEIYADRPVEKWQRSSSGEWRMATLPLDMESLLRELSSEEIQLLSERSWKLPHETRIGHIHLHVSSLAKAEKFYHEVLGFDVTLRSYPGALFMSAGSYHHHVGANIWAGINAPPTPDGHVQLHSFSIKLSSQKWLQLLVNRLREAGVDFENAMVNPVEGYEGVATHDFDGNLVEIVAPTKY